MLPAGAGERIGAGLDLEAAGGFLVRLPDEVQLAPSSPAVTETFCGASSEVVGVRGARVLRPALSIFSLFPCETSSTWLARELRPASAVSSAVPRAVVEVLAGVDPV